MIGFPIDLPAKQRQDRLLQDQIKGRQPQAGCNTQQDCAANTLMGGLFVSRPQADTDEGTAAVTDHHRNRQRHHCQRKNHRIGGVSIGTQIVRVGDKDLIHDVIERCHQQGDHTGNGIFSHQFAQPFRFQK